MKDQLMELVRIIEAEIGIQNKMISKLEQQQQILVGYALEKLEENLKQLEDLHPEARRLAKERLSLKERIARRMGLNKSLPLSELSNACVGNRKDQDLKARIDELRDRLMTGAKQIRMRSRQNMILIRQSLELNHDLIKWIQGRETDHTATYGRSGEIHSSSNPSLVDAHV